MKDKFTVPFLLLAVIFCVFLILSNLLEVKIVKVGFMTVTAGLGVFPISYIINDCFVEGFGFKRARFGIWFGFMVYLLVIIFLQ